MYTFQNFITFLKILFSKKIRKILEFHTESCYKNTSKIRNSSFMFQNIEKTFKKWWNWRQFWKINEFIGNKKEEVTLLLYGNFVSLFHNFLEELLCKINVLDIFDMDNFFQIFLTSSSAEISDRIKLLVRNIRAICF